MTSKHEETVPPPQQAPPSALPDLSYSSSRWLSASTGTALAWSLEAVLPRQRWQSLLRKSQAFCRGQRPFAKVIALAAEADVGVLSTSMHGSSLLELSFLDFAFWAAEPSVVSFSLDLMCFSSLGLRRPHPEIKGVTQACCTNAIYWKVEHTWENSGVLL